MASAPSTFTSFMGITGPAFLTGADQIVNEAVKQTYILGRFLRDADMSKTLQGGADIRDTVMLDEQSTFRFYHPNATFTPSNPQVTTNWKTYWRFGVDHMSWTDQEIELQVPEGLTSVARHQIYKRIKYSKEQRMWTSKLNGMEDALWAVPETADMEAEDGKKPYSIPAHINEWGFGQFYSRVTATVTGKTTWTTKQNINPSTEPGWRLQLSGTLPAAGYDGITGDQAKIRYNSTSIAAVAGSRTLFDVFDNAWAYCNFVAPPTRQQYFENSTLHKQFVATSFSGHAAYKKHLRGSQDTLTSSSREDPQVVNPAYAGIDIVRVKALNEALLYPHATAATAPVGELDSNAEDIGQRFYFTNGNYLCPVFHSRRYMEKHAPMRHRDQPFTTVQYCDTWYNVPARSMQRHCIVGPAGDSDTTKAL